MWMQTIGSHLRCPGHRPGEQPEGLTRRSSLEQSFLGSVPEGFLVPSVQNLWRKTLDMRFDRGANKCPLLGNSHFCPQPSVVLLCLAQSNQCADYCTTAFSWTGSLNTGATEQDLQKLPSGCLKSSPGLWEKLHSGFPPRILLHWLSHTQGLWFSVLTWHICCRLGNWQWI